MTTSADSLQANVADQADTITAPTFLDEAPVALTQLDVVDGTSFAHR
jgi:BRCT domain type II-containing protein